MVEKKGVSCEGPRTKSGHKRLGMVFSRGCPYLDGQTCTGLAWQSLCRCYLRFPFVQKSVHSFPFMQSGHVFGPMETTFRQCGSDGVDGLPQPYMSELVPFLTIAEV